jgi:uncharacterized protein
MKTFIQFIVQRRLFVLTLVLLVTALLGSQIRNLKIVIDPVAMLPKAHPNVIGTTAAETIFGSKYVIVIGVSAADGGTALRPDVLNTISNLTQQLSGVAGVKRHTILSVTSDRAKSITGVKGEMQVTPMLEQPISSETINQLNINLANNPTYEGTLISKDKSVVSISFSVDIGPKGFREVVERVTPLVEAARTGTINIDMSGTPVFFAAVETFAQRMAYLFPIAVVLIGLIHYEAFRTVQGMLLPLLTAILAVVWSMGLMGALKVPFDAFNATTPILILAVAAGHAVQILKRYYEEYDRLRADNLTMGSRKLNDSAIVESLTRIGPVMLTAGLVAAAGFFSLMSFEIATIRTFGIITGLGVLCALVIELTLIPALRSFLKPPPPQALESAKPKATLWDRFIDQLVTLVLESKKRIAACFVVIALISTSGVVFLNRENSTKSYFGESLTVRLQDRFLNAKLAGTNTLYVVFQSTTPDAMKQPHVLRTIEKVQRYIETLPDVGKTISIVNPIKQMHQAMNDGSQVFSTLPTSQDLISQYLLLYSISGQPSDFDSYVDYEYRNANLVVWMKNDSSRYAENIVNQIRTFVQPLLSSGVTVQIGGSIPQTSALSESLVQGKLTNIAQMIGVVFIAGILIFRSAVASAYLVLPLLVTVLVNFGFMGLFGIPLNTPNSVSSAMGIGIGADYAIYILYRLREEMQSHKTFEEALRTTMRTAGKAVVYVATAVAGGYSVLLLSFDFYVHIWFGLLIVMSMIVSAITALVLIPTLLSIYTPKCLRKAHSTTIESSEKSFAPSMIFIFSWALISQFSPTSAQAQTINADELMQHSYQANRMDSSTSAATFRLVSSTGQERIRKTLGMTKLAADGQLNRRIIRFLAPADIRNTASLLMETSKGDDEIWVYLPALKKARRLASSNKKGSFFGTDLSYGDVVGHKPDAWKHRWIKTDTADGQACEVIESIPGNSTIADESGYSKRLSCISKQNHMPLKVEIFDLFGAPLKKILSRDLKLVDASRGKWQAMKLEAMNTQTGHSTTILMDRFDANQPIPEEMFSQRYIEREE